MNSWRPVGWLFLFIAHGCLVLSAFTAPGQAASGAISVREAQGIVEVSPAGAQTWVRTQNGQVLRPLDRVRTGANSRAALLWSDSSVVNFGSLTEIEILPPHVPGAQSGLRLAQGLFSFFHRDKPGRIRVITRGAVAGIYGTGFAMAVEMENNVERTTLSVIDGRVGLTNAQGFLVLTADQQGIAVEGQEPQRVVGFVANNLLQWAFYYPAVLDLRDLPLSPDEEQALANSRAAYRSGDLLDALAKYGTRQPSSDAERIYQAALFLSVGEVTQASNALAQVQNADATARVPRLAASLQQLIAAVKRESLTTREAELPTELLAASYYEQSRGKGDLSLKAALALANRAATNSPDFGFAWARVAELEFSFGRTDKALDALNKSLAISPRNAEALALKGFLLAAQNNPRQAIEWFNQAIAVDAALANAWLGRGLCRIRQNDSAAGREDLLIAAALEPRRAQLRSYLGKSFGDAGDKSRALHELDLAKGLDAGDPTAWLYSALVKAENSRVNEGIRDLETSQELNDNRSVYRSRFRLDEDRAVRSANLARLYADADMTDVAVREAGRGVAANYANYSSHLFLANSYEVERRANLSNLRFEAASFNEYLLANLLGPANGGLLAQSVSQLEYSKLFDRNRVGVIANTEYFGRGAWHHSSAQYGTLNNMSYSLEAEYRSEAGERINQDFEFRQLEGKFKYDITPDDSVYFHVIDVRTDGGDLGQYFKEREVSRELRFDEKQTPTVLAGYHHQWNAQNHSLFLAGRFDDSLHLDDPTAIVLALDRFMGANTGLAPVTARNLYRNRAEVYTVEAQQISIVGQNSLIAGARATWTKQDVSDRISNPNGDFLALLGTNVPVSLQGEEVWSTTAAVYAYDYLQVLDTMQIVGGLNYTYQSLPENLGTAPISTERDHQQRLSPKAGIVWSPAPYSMVRASYTRSLAGSGLGQSVRLEPTHVAGLLQTIREPVPVSVVGPLDGADLETAEVVWDGRFDKTYLSAGAQWLEAKRNRKLGLFLSDPQYDPGPDFGLIRERVRFREKALDLSAHQLIGEEWSFGARYRLSYAELRRRFPEYPGLAVGGLSEQSDWDGWLHTINLSGLYRHHSGLFARTEAVFFGQDRERDGHSLDDDDFWQLNVVVGYRFPRQKAEIAVGVLNLLDCNYRLDPINRYAEQPRAQTFYARLLLNF